MVKKFYCANRWRSYPLTLPIGGVIATKGLIIPNAVGVDIGCGMCAMRTNVKASEVKREDLISVMRHIRVTIPLGFDHQSKAPSAYKDIDVVMENEKDLVKPLVELVPLAVIKGE